MKCSVFIVIVCIGCVACTEKKIVQLPPERVAQILPVAMQCVGETGVTPEIIFLYKEGKPIGDDRRIQKFIHCAFMRTGYIDKNGFINIDKVMELFPRDMNVDKITKAMEKCNEEKGRDPYETAYKVAMCFRDKSPVRVTF